MIKTALFTLAAVNVNGVKLAQDTTLAAAVKQIAANLSADDIKVATDFAAKHGFSVADAAGIEGALTSGAVTKQSVKNWVLWACEKFQITEEKSGEMLADAGKATGVTAANGIDLIAKAGEAFDISQAEFDATVKECFKKGAAVKVLAQ